MCDEPLKQIVAYGERKSTNRTSLIDLSDEHTRIHIVFNSSFQLKSSKYGLLSHRYGVMFMTLLSSFKSVFWCYFWFNFIFLMNYYVLLSRFKHFVRIMILDLRYCITSLIILVLLVFVLYTNRTRCTYIIHI